MSRSSATKKSSSASLTRSDGKSKRGRRRGVDWQRAEKLYTSSGLSYSEVARRLGHGPAVIRQGLLRLGVPRHPRSIRASSDKGRRLHALWCGMHHRCKCPDEPGYKYFGARGVGVCRAWMKFEPFFEWAISTGYRRNLVLTLKSFKRNYSPSNCEWVSRKESSKRIQSRTEYKLTYTITAFGETKGRNAWARDPRCNVSVSTLIKRIDEGWSTEDALTRLSRHAMSWSPKPITAFGKTKSSIAWSNDPRCSVRPISIRNRIARGFAPEIAVTAPAGSCLGSSVRRD